MECRIWTFIEINWFLIDTLRWSKITAGGTTLSPRYHHSAVAFKDSIFVFGGTDGVNNCADFLEYKISKLKFLLVENNSKIQRELPRKFNIRIRRSVLSFIDLI